MKKIFIISIITLISTFGTAFRQIKLSLNPVVGSKYQYFASTTQIMTQPVMEQSISIELNTDILYEILVVSKEAENITLDVCYKEFSMSMASPLISTSFSTNDAKSDTSEIPRMISALLKNILNKHFQFILGTDGSVKEFKNLDEIFEDIQEKTGSDSNVSVQMTAILDSISNPETMKNFWEQSFKIYPSSAVKTGDSWNTSYNMSISGITTNINNKFTLKNSNKDNTEITSVTTLDMQSDNENVSGEISGSGNNMMMIDTKSGMPSSATSSLHIKGNFKANEIDVPIDITTITNIRVEKIK